MANNKNPIVSVSLSSKLNMNKNREVIEPNSDMLNDVNSPIYGGNLANLFYKPYGNSYRSLIDKHGDGYYPTNVEPKGVVKINPNNSNSERILDYDHHFVLNEFKNAPFDFDQAIVRSVAVSSHGESATYMVNGLYTDGDLLKLGEYTADFDADGNVRYLSQESRTLEISSSEFPVNYTLRKLENNEYIVIVVARNKSIVSNTYSLYTIRLTQYGVPYTGTPIPITFKLNGTSSESSKTFFDSGVIGDGTRIDNSFQIILSSMLGENNTYKTWGISILNKKQIGECTHKSLGFANFMMYFINNIPAPALNQVKICPSIQNFRYQNWKLNDTGEIVEDSSDSGDRNIQENQCWGIFVDESTLVMQAFTFNDSNVPKYSSDDNYMGMMADFGNSNFQISESQIVRPLHWDNNSLVELVNPDDYLSNTFGHMLRAIWPSLSTNQRHHRFMISGSSTWPNNGNICGTAYMIDSTLPGVSLRLPGMQSTLSIPTDKTMWESGDASVSSLWNKRYEEIAGIYNSQGSRVTIKNSKFNVLFNYRQGYVSGISWSKDPYSVGTLITEWDSVDDGFFIQSASYNSGNDHWVLWKDCKSKTLKACITSSDPYYEEDLRERAMTIVGDRYVLFNTGAYYNCYDIETGKKGHWGSDWNDRVLYGVQMVVNNGSQYNIYSRAMNSDKTTKAAFARTATVASGVDVAYLSQKTFTPSKLFPYQTYQRLYTRNAIPIGAGVPSDAKVDLFMSQSSTAPVYKTSVKGIFGANGQSIQTWDGSLEGTTYPLSSSGTALNNMPITGLKFINSFSGKFGVKIGNTAYSIQYDGTRPIALYNLTSMVDDVKEFFIVQSQYYAVINDYICAISYNSNSSINGIEQIVNITGMQFIGALPSVAYFYSPAAKSIYAFTGDADLQLFVQTDLITEVTTWAYAPNNEWIYLATNNGLYVITQQNVFRNTYFEYDPFRIFATDKGYNVLETKYGQKYLIGIDKIDETGWYIFDVVAETVYFGPGDMGTSNIDCWYVKVYKGGLSNNGYVTLSSKTVNNNSVVENNRLRVQVSSDMWTSNDTYTIRYQPENPIGQGQSLKITSSYPIAAIMYSTKDEFVQTPVVQNENAAVLDFKI